MTPDFQILRFASHVTLAVALAFASANRADAQLTGPSSTQPPYIIPVAPDVVTQSLLTVGDSVNLGPSGQPYRLVGKPDGLGAFDNGDGTFTLLVNHELGSSEGIVRLHGGAGAFVSRWIINKAALQVVSGRDLIQVVHAWDRAGGFYFLDAARTFSRFCSADLPAPLALYNPATGRGTTARIFFNGEETGTDGKSYAHIVSGPDAGHTWELPRTGRFNRENSVVAPGGGDTTVLIGLDDTVGGQLYVYVGTKSGNGDDIERAGLRNGQLFGVVVDGQPAEHTAQGLIGGPSRPFSLYSFGNVEGWNGTTLETESNLHAVMKFQRPEDGHWDPGRPNDFYFATTGSAAPPRFWRLRFTDVTQPALGGTIDMLLDGSEGTYGLDNITVENARALIQEDGGSQLRLAKIWMYDIPTDALTELARHNPAFFDPAGANFLTSSEESSGIIDMRAILGGGWYLLTSQAHYGIAGDLVEGGQLLAMFVPQNEFARGDMNCDGFVSLSDIGPFALAIVDPPAYAAAFPDCPITNADLDRSGAVDPGDIGDFVAILIEHLTR